ncbi:MAG: 16S rRNA (cytosine(1402)-N(4))-methyltransferase RsmH [Bifidobacteriaceae bacterium]|jgi:16S rRNA (cytosine1402-N4)-methyltransferase|nr:16S rRNA (cytosine(1402)-N(4))-methyltransferase RsmH [Bifidobacteriaceae bacterium]
MSESKNSKEFNHISVMKNEVLRAAKSAFLNKENPIMVDCTLGFAGHTFAALQEFKNLYVYGIDRDLEIKPYIEKNLANYSNRFRFVNSKFSEISSFVESADFILFDLGVSSMQIDNPERGFSYMADGVLDMRMNRDENLDAKRIVNAYSFDELKTLFAANGEKNSASIAKNIVKMREESEITTTSQLVKIADLSVPKFGTNRGHSAKRVFQALRIEVNDELGELKDALYSAARLLNPGGRLAVIDYHSLEAEIVKKVIRDLSADKTPKSIPLEPSSEYKILKTLKPQVSEIEKNSRAKSAHLRVLEKTANDGGGVK